MDLKVDHSPVASHSGSRLDQSKWLGSFICLTACFIALAVMHVDSASQPVLILSVDTWTPACADTDLTHALWADTHTNTHTDMRAERPCFPTAVTAGGLRGKMNEQHLQSVN